MPLGTHLTRLAQIDQQDERKGEPANPVDPTGRLAAILRRRGKRGPNAFVFGTGKGDYVGGFKTAWESLLLLADGHDTKRAKHSARIDRDKLHIDLHWHDLRHEGACRLLADGVNIRIIQLMLGHASVQQTQRYLNIIDEELRKRLDVSWKRRTLKGRRSRPQCVTNCHAIVTPSAFARSLASPEGGFHLHEYSKHRNDLGWFREKRARQDSNL